MNQPDAIPRELDELGREELEFEFIRRKDASEKFLDFVCYTKPDFQPSQHHYFLADKLERVIAGDITRLIVTMPPRHGKSEMASRRLPAYFLGRFPQKEIIWFPFLVAFFWLRVFGFVFWLRFLVWFCG